MSTTKKYVSLDKLGLYDEKIKGVISAGDEAALKSAKDYADSLATNYDAAGAAATVQGKLDGEVTRAKAREDEIAGLVATAQGEVDALETVVAGKAAQTDLDALSAKVGDVPEGSTVMGIIDEINRNAYNDSELRGMISDLDAAKADKTQVATDIAAAVKVEEEARIAAVKGVQDAVDALSGTHATDKKALEDAIALKADITALEEVAGVANAAATKTALEEEVTRAKGEETRIEGLVTAEAERAAAAEEALDERLIEVETFFKTAEGETIDQAMDTLVEIQKYITEDGAAADQMVKDIAANKKAIEDHVAVDHDFAGADAALKSELEGQIALKADKTTVEGIDGRLTTAEGKVATLETDMAQAKLDIDAVEAAVATKAEAQALTDAVTALQGVDAGQETRIAALEAKFGEGEGNVEDMIADAKQEAIDAAAEDATTKANAAKDAAIEKANELNTAMDTRVAGLEAASATHALASDLTALTTRVTTAEGEIDTLQTEMDAVEALADAADKAAKANAQAIALKASQADLEAVSGRVTTLETWHENFVECSQEDINGLFA